jgi:hypothetical protein
VQSHHLEKIIVILNAREYRLPSSSARLPPWSGSSDQREVTSGPTNSFGSAGTVSWWNVVIEPEKVMWVVLPLHRLQAS